MICLLLCLKWPSWNGVRGHWRFKSDTSLKSRSRSKFGGFADDVMGWSEPPRSRARAGNGAVHNEATKASLNLRHNSKFAILTLCSWIENPNYFSCLIQYMMNQFIIPFRIISLNKILQKILKINWSKKKWSFFSIARCARPYTTERNENSKRVHSAVNRCADRLQTPNLWSICHKSKKIF